MVAPGVLGAPRDGDSSAAAAIKLPTFPGEHATIHLKRKWREEAMRLLRLAKLLDATSLAGLHISVLSVDFDLLRDK